MFRSIVSRIERAGAYPDRQFTLDVYNRVLEGALYDHLPYGFHQEQSQAHEYIPVRDRRPSVRYNLCKLVVDDSVSLLFSEGHFPTPDVDKNPDAKSALLTIVKGCRLNDLMLEAATIGSVGSVAIQMRVLRQDNGTHKMFFVAHATGFLTPTYDKADPDRLVKITERYQVRGDAVKAAGYAVEPDQLNAMFWFQREWDETAETWYLPQLASKTEPPAVDTDKTTSHTLGFCPWVWIKNLPGKLKLVATDRDPAVRWSEIDGACTFSGAIDAMIEAEYQLSQAGRGLKYSMDPLLLIKEPAAPLDGSDETGGDMAKAPGTAIVVGEKGDAKLLELGGSAFDVVLNYVRALRELAIESAHGNRTDPQKLASAQSGRAMEMMNQALIWLADRLRVSYGEGALLSILKMALKAHAAYPLTIDDEELPKVDPKAKVVLKWPRWYAPTAEDRQANAITLKTLKEGGMLSSETGVVSIADDYDIEDVPTELARIEADRKALVADIPPASLQVRDTV